MALDHAIVQEDMYLPHVNQVVDLYRRRIDGQKLRGFVIDYTDEFTVVNVLDGDFRQNGFSVIRNRDVTKWVAYDKESYFLNRALRLKSVKPAKKLNIELASWATILQSAQERFPLLTIHEEELSTEVCYIGRLLGVTEKTYTVFDIDSTAEWIKPRRRRLADLTKVDFGGGYEDGLWRVAKEDDRLPQIVI